MKDSEFIELLNLYLDHEISPEDAARLEAEVQTNPKRRGVYQEYCRIQKGCKLLAQDFATEFPAADGKVVAFEAAYARQQSRRRTYVVGGMTAIAACVAALVVLRRPAAPVDTLATTASPAPVAASVAQTVAPQPQAVAYTEPTPANRQSDELSLRNNATVSQPLMLGTNQADARYAWMQNVRMQPIQLPLPADQLRVEINPNLRTENRTFSGRQPLPADVQWTAIRFQR